MAIDYKIRSIIKDLGHIKIDDMMKEVSSINPTSYYRAKTYIGNKGDFITSPEISQLFGEVIGFWVIRKWQELGQPEKIALIELGPGQGSLMRDLLRTIKLEPKLSQNLEIFLYEINKNFIKKQQNNLSFVKNKINWIDNINQLPPINSIIISNEFFDALPIKQYIKSRNTWYESVLISDPTDGMLKFSKIELNSILFNQLNFDHINAKDGALLEESAISLEIISKIARHLLKFKGSCLTIDYGYNIKPNKRTRYQYNSTLQAVKNHQYHPIIDSLGEADLSAHVDFYALKTASKQQGIKNILISSQREFLINNGIMIRHLNLKKQASNEDKNILDNQLNRLISKKQMGELFKVMEYDC